MWAPARTCTRNNVNEDYFFQTCRKATAYMSQCEHSLVANEGKFLFRQFASCHSRISNVEGSYSNRNNNRGTSELAFDDKITCNDEAVVTVNKNKEFNLAGKL